MEPSIARAAASRASALASAFRGRVGVGVRSRAEGIRVSI